MSLVYKVIGTVILILLLAPVSMAVEKDKWFARDKYEHFAVSVFYSAGTTVVAHRHFDLGKKDAPVVGFAVTISLGAAKEGYDHFGHKGTASIKDFIWDIAGALTGALAVSLSL